MSNDRDMLEVVNNLKLLKNEQKEAIEAVNKCYDRLKLLNKELGQVGGNARTSPSNEGFCIRYWATLEDEAPTLGQFNLNNPDREEDPLNIELADRIADCEAELRILIGKRNKAKQYFADSLACAIDF